MAVDGPSEKDTGTANTVKFANASSLEKVNKMLDILLQEIGQPNENGNHPFLSEDGIFRLSGNVEEVKTTMEALFSEPTSLSTNNVIQKPILAAHVMKNAIKDDRVKLDPKASQIFKDLTDEYAKLSRKEQDEKGDFFKILIDRLIQNNLLEEAKLVHNLMNLSYLVVTQSQLDSKEKSLRKSQMSTDAISKIILPNIIHRFIDSDPITELDYQNRTIAFMMRTVDKAVDQSNADFTKHFDIERPNEASTLAKKYEQLSQEPAKKPAKTESLTVSSDTKKPSLFSRAASFLKDTGSRVFSWLKETGKKVLSFITGFFTKKDKAISGPTPMEHLDQATKNNDSTHLDVSVQRDRVKGPAGRRLPTKRNAGQTDAPTVAPVKAIDIGPPTTPPPAPPTSLDVGPPLTPPPPPPKQADVSPNVGRPLPKPPIAKTPAQAREEVNQQLKEAERFGGERGGIVAERKQEIEKAESLNHTPSVPERRPPSMISAPEIQEGGVNVKKLKDMFEKKEQEKAKKEEALKGNPSKPKGSK